MKKEYKRITSYLFKGDLIAINYNNGDFKIAENKKSYAKIKRI